MTLSRTLSTGLLSAAFSVLALPAIAAPEISSGERVLETDFNGCMNQVDNFLSTLDIRISSGDISRTGYFEDGTFRVLCYPNPYENTNTSLAVVFAAHEADYDVAYTFVQIALDEIGN